MRGQVQRQQAMFVAFNIEERLPEDHPLRPITTKNVVAKPVLPNSSPG